MKLTKKELNEIIDSNGELIGNDDTPHTGSDLETQAKNTTDYNVKVGTQPFRYDMLGHFGFTLLPFFEGKEYNEGQQELINDLAKLMYEKYMETLEYYYRNPNKLKSDFRMHSEHDFDSQPEDRKKMDYEWAKKIADMVQKHFEGAFKEPEQLDEGKVAEDKMIDKKSEDEISKKSEDKDVKGKQVEKIAGLINKKFDKEAIDKLITLLEIKRG